MGAGGLHGQASAHGVAGGVGVGVGHAKGCQQSITQEFIHPAAKLLDHLAQALQKVAHQVGHLIGRQIFGEGGEVGQVGKQDGDEAQLAARVWGVRVTT